MASDFSRTLALLRKEKKISQRTAAGDLEVSQALLSHYENGLREPGLALLCVRRSIMGFPVITCWGAAWCAISQPHSPSGCMTHQRCQAARKPHLCCSANKSPVV